MPCVESALKWGLYEVKNFNVIFSDHGTLGHLPLGSLMSFPPIFFEKAMASFLPSCHIGHTCTALRKCDSCTLSLIAATELFQSCFWSQIVISYQFASCPGAQIGGTAWFDNIWIVWCFFHCLMIWWTVPMWFRDWNNVLYISPNICFAITWSFIYFGKLWSLWLSLCLRFH